MKNICLAWLDGHDLKRFAEKNETAGMLIAFLKSKESGMIDELHIIVNRRSNCYEFKDRFVKHVIKNYFDGKPLQVHEFDFSPNSYHQAFNAAINVLNQIKKNTGTEKAAEEIRWFFHFGSGTPQMNSVWIVLSKTSYKAGIFMTTTRDKNNEFDISLLENADSLTPAALKKAADNYDARLLKEWGDIPAFESVIHCSHVMSRIMTKAHRLALHDVPVLILGETGTGKELIAQAIHRASKRSAMPMESLNCAALHDSTANASLFGWSKGAWTGAVGEGEGLFRKCHGGTLFLDEIGDLGLETQTKLLRVLQEGEIQRVGDCKTFKVNVRVIAATNRNIRKLMLDGKFREDLYYRINVGLIKLPPLRERGDDPKLIASYFIERLNEEMKRSVRHYIPKVLTPEALDFISRYDWPGNIRELYNTIKRICVWHEGERVDEDDVTDSISELTDSPATTDDAELSTDNPINLNDLTNSIRKKYIMKALKLCNNRKIDAAKLLGINNYQNLSNEMKRLEID